MRVWVIEYREIQGYNVEADTNTKCHRVTAVDWEKDDSTVLHIASSLEKAKEWMAENKKELYITSNRISVWMVSVELVDGDIYQDCIDKNIEFPEVLFFTKDGKEFKDIMESLSYSFENLLNKKEK